MKKVSAMILAAVLCAALSGPAQRNVRASAEGAGAADRTLRGGQTREILTGKPVPGPADTAVPENTDVQNDYLDSLASDVRNGLITMEQAETLLRAHYRDAADSGRLVAEGMDYIRSRTQAPETTPEPEPFVFRSVKWGDSAEKVIQYEGSYVVRGEVPETLDGSYIRFATKAVGLDMLLDYFFSSKGLYMIRYTCSGGLSSPEESAENVRKIYGAYEKKYGPNGIYDEKWDSDEHKQQYGTGDRLLGEAILLGYFEMQAGWTLPDGTVITHEIRFSGETGAPVVTVTYYGAGYDPVPVDYSNEI